MIILLTKFIKEHTNYDGSQLSSLWAFRNFSLQGDSIVAFRGKCDIPLDNMVDLADVMAKDYIYSEDMLNFIIEFFHLDLEKTIYQQRLFITIIKETLEKTLNIKLTRSGDDLFYGLGKLTVSIATLSPVSSLIHTGINISSHNTPVKTASLGDLGVTDIEDMASQLMKSYTSEIANIKLARCKVRGVP